jgi:succinate dehydrogenase / fumarate reductase cytochrome b subunit
MANLRTTATGYVTYRGREGQVNYLLHRFTGLGTLLFLTIHILDTSTVYFFPSLYDHAIALYRNTWFGLGEIVLVFCVIFHGVNGLRIAAFDMFWPKYWNIPDERASARWTLGISLVLFIPAAVIMLLHILQNNFGLAL